MGGAAVVHGLAALQRALRRTEGDLDKFVKLRLRAIAEPIKGKAIENIQHKTGRHSAPPGQRLEDSLKISVTQRAVTVYSNRLWSGVQDRGGRVGHGAILKRADVSGYLTKAQREGELGVETELVALGGDIEREFERG